MRYWENGAGQHSGPHGVASVPDTIRNSFKVYQSSNIFVEILLNCISIQNSISRFESIPFEESNGATEVVKVEVKLAQAADIEALYAPVWSLHRYGTSEKGNERIENH